MNKLIATLIFIFVIIIFFSRIYSLRLKYTPFHSDEVLWPCQGYIYNLLVKGDFHSRLWTKSIWDFTSNPIPRYIYGWWINTKIGSNYYKEFNCYNYAYYLNKSLFDLNDVQKSMLFSLRGVNQVFALVVLVLSFLLFQNLFGTFIASIGILLLGFNPLFMTYADRAMTDMIYLFFLLTGLILVRIFQIAKNKYQVKLVICIGISTGLAIMTKPFGIMILAVWFCTLLFMKINIKNKVFLIAICFLTTIGTLILVYPPFWNNSLVTIINWFRAWMSIHNDFQLRYPTSKYNGPLDFISTTFTNVVYPGKYSIFRFFPSANILLIVPGIILTILKIVQKHKFTGIQQFVFATTIGIIFTCMFTLKMKWERYFLLPMFSVLIFQLLSIKLFWLKTKLIFARKVIDRFRRYLPVHNHLF